MAARRVVGFLVCLIYAIAAVAQGDGPVAAQRVEPVIELIPTNGKLYVLVGETASLWCKIIQGDPLPTVTWVKGPDNTPVGSGEELRFDLIKLEDAGGYRCTASNSVGDKTGSFNVNVYGYEELAFFLGDTGKISNQFGKNGIKLTWYNTNLMPGDTPDDKYKVAEWLVHSESSDNVKPGYDVDNKTGDLQIPSVTLDHEGWYTAFMMDPMTENKHGYSKVIVFAGRDVKPVIEMIPANGQLAVLVGETASLWCKVTQGDPLPTVTWVKGPNDTPVGSGEELRFDPAKLEDRAGYKCTASNSAGDSTGMFAVGVYGYEELAFFLGDTGKISNPHGKNGIKLTWYNTNLMPGDSVDDKYKVAEWLVLSGSSANVKPGYDVDNKTGDLLIPSVDLDHEGWYTAFLMDPMAENKYGYSKVIVFAGRHDALPAPTFDVKISPRQIITEFGASPTIRCTADVGKHADSIRWKRLNDDGISKTIFQTYPTDFDYNKDKYSVRIPNSGTVDLTIKNISSEDGGKYICEPMVHADMGKVAELVIRL